MTTERKPHKYAEAIKAWADGKPIQFKTASGRWYDYIYISDCTESTPRFDQFEWRVKPENIVFEKYVFTLRGSEKRIKESVEVGNDQKWKPNIRLEFDPDTYKLIKAEVIG